MAIDAHKNYLLVVVLDEKGKVLDKSRIDNNLHMHSLSLQGPIYQ